jgi:hypothetical protein
MKSSANKQSHSVQRADVPIPEPAADNAIFARMQSNLHPLVNRLLAFCNIGTPLLVYPRDPTATFGQDADPFLSGLPANFPIYTIESAEHPISGSNIKKTPFGVTIESHPRQLGAVTHNWCSKAAYLCRATIEKVYKDDEDIVSVAWTFVTICPRAVFLSQHKVGREDVLPDHDILIICTKSGAQCVFDPTGYQYSIMGYLYRWAQYQQDFVKGHADSTIDGLVAWFETGMEEPALQVRRAFDEVVKKTKEDILRGGIWR